MNLKFLPLGSTCVTNNADLKLVVIGYKANGFDYVAVEYPVGYENEGSLKYFNHDQILDLCSYGYKDEMGKIHFVSLDDGTPNAVEPEEENIDLVPVMAFEELNEDEPVAFVADELPLEEVETSDSLDFKIEMPEITLDDTPITFNDDVELSENLNVEENVSTEENPFVFEDNVFGTEEVTPIVEESENLFVSDTVVVDTPAEETVTFDESLFAPVAPFIEETTPVAIQDEVYNPEVVSPEIPAVEPVEAFNPEVQSTEPVDIVSPEVAPVTDTIIFTEVVPTVDETVNIDIPAPEAVVVEADSSALDTFALQPEEVSVENASAVEGVSVEPKKEEKKKRGFFNFGR